MNQNEFAKIDAVTGTLVPTPGPNLVLPTLNPLKARSSIAGVLAILSIVSPLLNGGIGEIVSELLSSEQVIQQQSEIAIASINALVGVVGLVWFWIERRAPNFRLSFKSQ
jgi:hypothetical protein